MAMYLNAAMCNWCEDIIVSKHRHDFVTCKCYSDECGIFLDGGFDYRRVGYADKRDFRNLEISIDIDDLRLL